jgi:hypothetical protein
MKKSINFYGKVIILALLVGAIIFGIFQVNALTDNEKKAIEEASVRVADILK